MLYVVIISSMLYAAVLRVRAQTKQTIEGNPLLQKENRYFIRKSLTIEGIPYYVLECPPARPLHSNRHWARGDVTRVSKQRVRRR